MRNSADSFGSLEFISRDGVVGSTFLLGLLQTSGLYGLATWVLVSGGAGKTAVLDLLSLTAWQTLFGAVPLLFVVLLVPSQPIVWSSEFVVALVYNVIPGTAIAMLLWLYVLNHLSASTAGLAMLMNPVVRVLTAWLRLGEQPGLKEFVGILLFISALVFNSMQKTK